MRVFCERTGLALVFVDGRMGGGQRHRLRQVLRDDP